MRRLLPAGLVLLGALVLAGCIKVEVDHFFEEDGSSIFQFAIGSEIDPDEDESIDCVNEVSAEYPGSYANLSFRGSETWCTSGIPRETPLAAAALLDLFNEEDEFIRVNCLSVEAGHLIYDIEILLEATDEEPDPDAYLHWRVTAPGTINSTNADSQSGNTAMWDLTHRAGWVSMQVNADGVDCPRAGFTLDLIADSGTGGTAYLSAGKPSHREEDGAALIAALSGAGWQVTERGDDIEATTVWSDAAALQALANGLPMLDGTDLTVAGDDEGGSEFEARLDFSFYEAFWQGINPEIEDPPFRFSWTPIAGDAESSGDWTDAEARTFNWTVDDAGRIFNMSTVTVEAPIDDDDDGAADTGDSSGDPLGEDVGESDDGDPEGAEGDTDSDESEQAATAGLVDELLEDDADEHTRAATTAAVVGLLAAAGLTALSVAESGMSMAELLDALRRGDGDDFMDQARDDDPVPAGGIRIWDESAGRARVFDSHEAAEQFAAELRAREAQQSARDTAQAMDESRGLQAEANAEELADIRADRAAIEYWTQLVRAREAALARLEQGEAEQAAIRGEGWQRISDDTLNGIRTELEALPGEVRDAAWATRQALDAVAAAVLNPENFELRVLAETALETVYDVLGMMSGGAFGDGYESVQAPVEFVARVGGALAQAAWDDPQAFFEMVTPIGDLRASMDPDNTLGQRLGHMGFALADVFMTVAGVGLADEFADGARLAGATDDARHATTAVDTARQADRAGEAARAAEAARDAERATAAARAAEAARDAERAAEAARDAERAAEATRAAEAARDAERAAEAARDAERAASDAWVRGLPEGAAIEANFLHEVGYSQRQIDALGDVARRHNIEIGSRTTNMESMHWIRDGKAAPKPMGIKAKTINNLDTYLGANKADEGLVGYFRPTEPDLRNVPANLHDDVMARYSSRMDEYRNLRTDVDDMVMAGEVVERNGMLFKVTETGELPFAGDIDLVYLRNADGTHLSGDKYLEVLEDLKSSPAGIQHGAETDLINYKTKGLEPGSAEWHEAYEDAVKLHEVLEGNHLTGKEIIMQVGEDGVLRRGPQLDELPRLSQS